MLTVPGCTAKPSDPDAGQPGAVVVSHTKNAARTVCIIPGSLSLRLADGPTQRLLDEAGIEAAHIVTAASAMFRAPTELLRWGGAYGRLGRAVLGPRLRRCRCCPPALTSDNHRTLFEEDAMRTAAPDATWNDCMIAALRSLWGEGLSTAEIGRRLGVTKNAVVGKARRLDLATRPSPIRQGGRPKPGRPPRAAGPTLPPLVSLQGLQVPAHTPARRTEPAPPVIRTPALVSDPAKLGTGQCCWPIGDPGKKDFRFCNEPNQQARPYCPEHCAQAYVRNKRNDERRAA
jgi:GcrA cell cycle regulator